MPKVEQHTALHLLESKDAYGASAVAVLDAGMACVILESRPR